MDINDSFEMEKSLNFGPLATTLTEQILVVLHYLLALTFSIVYLGFIVYHEHYGEDPQRRTLVNYLMSMLCSTLMFIAVTTIPIALLRTIWGSLPLTLTQIYLFIHSVGSHLSVILFAIGITFLAISLTRWKLVAALNENFWGFFLSLEAFTLLFLYQLARLYSGKIKSSNIGDFGDIPLARPPNLDR